VEFSAAHHGQQSMIFAAAGIQRHEAGRRQPDSLRAPDPAASRGLRRTGSRPSLGGRRDTLHGEGTPRRHAAPAPRVPANLIGHPGTGRIFWPGAHQAAAPIASSLARKNARATRGRPSGPHHRGGRRQRACTSAAQRTDGVEEDQPQHVVGRAPLSGPRPGAGRPLSKQYVRCALACRETPTGTGENRDSIAVRPT